MTYRLGIDVGGTFTDLIAFEETEGALWTVKTPSTPGDPSVAVASGVAAFLMRCGNEVSLLVHASTIGTNLFLGQMHLRLPKAALLTTAGFRDVLEIGRQRRAELYNLFFERPRSLIPRHLRYGIRQRIDAAGEMLESLDEVQVRSIAETLVHQRVEVVAVCYLHSYSYPDHEARTRALLQERFDGVVVLSSEVDPHYREYERTSTTVVNALLVPVVSQYLRRLEGELRALGVSAPLYVMQSSGGMTTFASAIRLPAAVIESGPAAGVVGAAYLARVLGLGDILSFDMGGTTAKAGTVVNGAVQVVTEYEIAGKVHAGRIVKGSGYPVRFPFVDLAEVSAGGGTIAWVEHGALRVGPLSAGADPGPAAYGRGGQAPTVTDCNLILGRLSPRGLLDGSVRLDLEAARKAVQRVAAQIGLDTLNAAEGILQIVQTQMVRALRLVSLERGHDPRAMTMVAFGGAGPMHAAFLADELDIRDVIIPPAPGLFSSFGLLVADVRRDAARAILRPAVDALQPVLDAAFVEMREELRRALEMDGLPLDSVVIEPWVDLRYRGQSYELSVRWTRVAEVVAGFHQRHQDVYGYMALDEPVEVVTARAVAWAPTRKPELQVARISGPDTKHIEVRDVFFHGWCRTPVYRRETLPAGWNREGPLIVEQYDTTIVVPPGWAITAGRSGILHLRHSGKSDISGGICPGHG